MMSSFINEDDEAMDRVKKMDMMIAQKIASYAGITLRDRHSNLTDDVWHAANSIKDTTNLLDTASMRRILLDQLNQHLQAQKDLLLASDSQDVLVQWILDFQHKWETQIARQREKKYDISMRILTVMEEALTAVHDILQYHDIAERDVIKWFDQVQTTHTYDNNHEKYVRLMYRCPTLGPQMCCVAGKLLQKQLVCNRSGAYSSTKQRNDVTQERDEAMMALTRHLGLHGGAAVRSFMETLHDPDELGKLLVNHRSE
jgi:hypothetical protein